MSDELSTGACKHPSHPAHPGRIWPAASWGAGVGLSGLIMYETHNPWLDLLLFVILFVAGVAVLLDPHRHRATSIEPELRKIAGRPKVSQARRLELEDELFPLPPLPSVSRATDGRMAP